MAHLNSNLQQLEQTPLASSAWARVRANARDYFSGKGVPSRQEEAWKYTSLRGVPWERLEWHESKSTRNKTGKTGDLVKQKVAELSIPGALALVFVDGVLDQEFSKISELKKTLKLEIGDGQLSRKVLRAFKEMRALVKKVEQDSLEALNAMSLQSLLTLSVGKERSVTKPVQLIYLSFAKQRAFQPRVQVHIGQRSKLTLIETFWQAESSESLQNSVCEIQLRPQSGLNYLRLVEGEAKAFHVGRTRVYQQEQSSFEGLSLLLNTHLSRHNLEIFLAGMGAHAQVNGAVLVSGQQHADHHTVIDHVVGQCTSNQLYKNLLADQSRAIFDGKVVIRQDSQKAFSEQLNNNLLLSSQAESDSKPQLEIYADDVKATHGSTVGQLSEEELFYFLSRGISRAAAEEMLSLGFVAEMANRNSDEKLAGWTLKRLQNAYRRMKS